MLYAAMLLPPVTTASPISVNSEAVIVSSEPMSANPADAALSPLEKQCANLHRPPRSTLGHGTLYHAAGLFAVKYCYMINYQGRIYY
jgi:hypothetical protein